MNEDNETLLEEHDRTVGSFNPMTADGQAAWDMLVHGFDMDVVLRQLAKRPYSEWNTAKVTDLEWFATADNLVQAKATVWASRDGEQETVEIEVHELPVSAKKKPDMYEFKGHAFDVRVENLQYHVEVAKHGK